MTTSKELMSALRARFDGPYYLGLASFVDADGTRRGHITMEPWDAAVAAEINEALKEFDPVLDVVEGKYTLKAGHLHVHPWDGKTSPAFTIDGVQQARLWTDGVWRDFTEATEIIVAEYEGDLILAEQAASAAQWLRTRAEKYADGRDPCGLAPVLRDLAAFLEKAGREGHDFWTEF